uniref:Uncharacterized protein n=1 Tax=Globodera rostochiensis TaxID=31243 RepID=A0A914HNR6_GLORO
MKAICDRKKRDTVSRWGFHLARQSTRDDEQKRRPLSVKLAGGVASFGDRPALRTVGWSPRGSAAGATLSERIDLSRRELSNDTMLELVHRKIQN